ncbi:MAG: electron transfer flavoprotein subunit alpha/FixB family protein [Syntrophales bacterium]|nr:electron transfer flavoprotein subunit alpha/FixB family protein [Syntrophales bacterium]
MAGIWIYAEKHDNLLELLNIGGQLATEMGGTITVLANARLAGFVGEYARRGARQVLQLPDLPADQPLEAFIPIIAEEIRGQAPDLILMADTIGGRDMAARLAARLDAALCSHCHSLEFDRTTNDLIMTRPMYGGVAVQKVTSRSRPVMAAIPPRTYDPAAATSEGSDIPVRTLPLPPVSTVTVVERRPKEKVSRNLGEARVIVSVGRGLAKAEDLTLIRRLADALGAEIGCTRPIAEELHWLPEDCCIGLSGIQVKPDIFVAAGVSGQIQHVTGIRGAKIIAAINRDENAPIFTVADYGIVGDLYEVIPKLLDELK